MNAEGLYDRPPSVSDAQPGDGHRGRNVAHELDDALVLPNRTDTIDAFRAVARTLEFIEDQYRHYKPILPFDGSDQLLKACEIDRMLPNRQRDPGVLVSPDPKTAADDFVAAIAKHRRSDRETAPLASERLSSITRRNYDGRRKHASQCIPRRTARLV